MANKLEVTLTRSVIGRPQTNAKQLLHLVYVK